MAGISVPPEILRWACERAGHDVAYFAERLPGLRAWIRREQQPTLKQLEKLAKVTHTPLGFLFLSEPLDEPLPVPDYRTISGKAAANPSPDLLDTLYAMQSRQAWLRESLVEQGIERLAFAGSASLADKPESAGSEMRSVLDLDEGWANRFRTWQDATSVLRQAIENLRIMAVINGVVGNNTHRPLSVTEFRGFALTDPFAPLIFVNGADAKSAQMFTLAHELAHIWLGRDGLSGFDMLLPGDNEIETWCDRAAAEFLAPAQEVRARWPDVEKRPDPFKLLARAFKVSPVVAARRALDLMLIDRQSFCNFYEDYTRQEHKSRAQTIGGNFYNSQNTRVGKYFATQVVRAAKGGRIRFKEAYDLTGLHGGTFQEYARRIGISLP